MKKQFRNYLLISLGLIYALMLLLVFLTAGNRIKTGLFWFSLVFAIIIPCLLTAFVFWYTYNNQRFASITVPGVCFVVLGFDAVNLIINVLFLYIGKNFKLPIVLNAILLVIEFIVVGYTLFAAKYISKNQEIQKEKVYKIRDLRTDVDYAISLVEDEKVKKELQQLSEDIRYSDPMSHDSLEELENEIRGKVNEIMRAAQNKEWDKITPLYVDASNLLKLRNNKCLNLKK